MKRLLTAGLLMFFPFITYASGLNYIWKPFTLPSGLVFWATQVVQAKEVTEKEQYALFIGLMERRYGLKENILLNTAKCESNLTADVYGDKGKAYGILQFWEGTFQRFKEEADMLNLDYKNPYDQITLAGWAFSEGYAKHWTCYNLLGRNATH